MNDDTNPATAQRCGPTVTAAQWLAGFAAEIGSPAPDAATTEALLALAGVAAHDSERIAAPIACWMAGVAGVAPVQALERARRYADERAS